MEINMTGGSMNYLYSQLQYAEFKEDTHLRKLFREHLNKVAEALHDIEWVDSADYGPGDEEAAIIACLGGAYYLERELLKVKSDLEKIEEQMKEV
jgi:hypothetical protein